MLWYRRSKELQIKTEEDGSFKAEKYKIELEVNILNTTQFVFCRQLQKNRTKHISSVIVRDSLRTEVSKQRAIANDVREKQDQLRIDIDVLNLMIGRSEELMVQLRKRYEEEIQKRNDRFDAFFLSVFILSSVLVMMMTIAVWK